MVGTAGLTFLGWSAKAQSYIQRVGPQEAPPKNRDQLPLWHCVYLRNEFNCSYYNMKMIRRGVLTWGQLQSLEDVRLLNALPRTWKGVYNHGGRLLNIMWGVRLTAGAPRSANTRGMGAMGKRTATAEGAGLCTTSAVAQTDGACKSLQEVRHRQVPDMLAKGVGQTRYG